MLSNSESDSILFGLVKVAEANIFLFAFTEQTFLRKPVRDTAHREWEYHIKHFRHG